MNSTYEQIEFIHKWNNAIVVKLDINHGGVNYLPQPRWKSHYKCNFNKQKTLFSIQMTI